MISISSTLRWGRCLSVMACVLTLWGVAVAEDASAYPLLRDSLDSEFHRMLKAQIAGEFKCTRQQQVPNKKVSLVVVDITDLRHPRVAAENGGVMLYAASLLKIAILLGAYVQAEKPCRINDRALFVFVSSYWLIVSEE